MQAAHGLSGRDLWRYLLALCALLVIGMLAGCASAAPPVPERWMI